MKSKNYTIYAPAGYTRDAHCTAEQAIQKASSYMYVSPMRRNALAQELEIEGVVSYFYGFDCVTISEVAE